MVANGIVRAKHASPASARADQARAVPPPSPLVRAASSGPGPRRGSGRSGGRRRAPRAGQPPWGLWLYAIGLSLLLLSGLFALFLHIPQVPEHKAPLPPTEEAVRFTGMRLLFVMTMGMTLCCGALGGCLFNMRGLIKHALEKNFDRAYHAAYLLHPFAGALSGFIVFLVLVGGLFAMEVQPPHTRTDELDWIILRRQLPFMAFATLAGYASHVFMMKLKDIAEVLFSIPERVNPVTKPQKTPVGRPAS